MIDNYQQFSDNSKVWIYQSDRQLKDSEVSEINLELNNFTDEWTSHNRQLQAFGKIFHNLFLVLMVDDSGGGASGCSIDSSVHFVKTLGTNKNIDFFNRMLFAYKDQKKIRFLNREEFQNKIDTDQINEDTLVFNNTINSKIDFEENWILPLKDSWHARFFTVR
jgi:hypothetical protein